MHLKKHHIIFYITYQSYTKLSHTPFFRTAYTWSVCEIKWTQMNPNEPKWTQVNPSEQK